MSHKPVTGEMERSLHLTKPLFACQIQPELIDGAASQISLVSRVNTDKLILM